VTQSRVEGLILGRRTGYLVGDIIVADKNDNENENTQHSLQETLKFFMVQPLYFGGSNNDDIEKPVSASLLEGCGLHIIHRIPSIGTKMIPENLYVGASVSSLSEAYRNPPSAANKPSGFDALLYIQNTVWNPTVIEKDIEEGFWNIITSGVADEVFQQQ